MHAAELQEDAHSTSGSLRGDDSRGALVQLFRARVEAFPGDVAFRAKHLGVYEEVTWADYGGHVERTAHGLLALGLQRGDRIAIMGDPFVAWLYADLAAQSIGCISYGVYPTTNGEDLRYLIQDGGARMLLAEDQEFVDRLLEAEGGVPLVEHIVVDDMRGMFAYDDPRIRSFADLEQLGSSAAANRPAEWPAMVRACHPDDIIWLSYTSGTTGRPKGVMMSTRNWMTFVEDWFLDRPEPTPADRMVASLPLAQAEKIFSLLLSIRFGAVTHFPEDVSALGATIREVRPTIFMGSPRTWEGYASQVQVGIETTDPLKRTAFRWATRARTRLLERSRLGSRVRVRDRLLSGLLSAVAFRPILDKFGFTSLRFVITTGAPVSPDIIQLWQTWGVNIMELYGQSECGFVTLQTTPTAIPGVAGKPLPSVELRLDEDGEILVRGACVFAGYWNNPEATAAALDREGWLHTGDVGELLPSGDLRVIDRKRDLIRLIDGTLVAAPEVEHALKFSPYIKDATVIGHGTAHLRALIEIDYDAVSEWARTNRVNYTTFSSLALNPSVRDMLALAVASANERLRTRGTPPVAAFRVLPRELDPETDSEITATRKVKRQALAARFQDLVDEMANEIASEPHSLQETS